MHKVSFSDNLFESYEISIYIFAITVAFSYAYALTTKTHIRIDALYVHLPYIYRVILDGTSKQIYRRLKTLIKKHGIYRTYNYDKARKSMVMLEDLRLPNQFLKELLDEN